MATTFKPIERGGRFGTHYLFDHIGDGIAMHTHSTRDMWHTTECIKGSVELYGDELDVTLKAGETAEFKSYRLHELCALEPGTEIINWFIHGRPSWYDTTPLDQLSGCVQSILTGRQIFP